MTNMTIATIAALVTAFVLTYITTPPIIKVSKEKKLFDEPNHRKLNKIVIPNLGGVSIFIGATLSSILFFPVDVQSHIQFLFAGLVLMLFVGLKDDIIGSSARNKLFMQILASVVLIFMGGMTITNLHQLFFIQSLPALIGVPLSLLFFLFIINAMNLIDGIDGLAAGIASLFLLVIGTCFAMIGNWTLAVICAAFLGSLLAFLRFNLFSKEYKIFMGDTGSLILGVLIAGLSISFINQDEFSTGHFDFNHLPAILLALLIIPVTDTLRVFFIRIRAGHSPFAPDMNHIHHVMIKSGLSHRLSSLLLVCWSLGMLVVVLFVQRWVPVTLSFLFVIAATLLAVNTIYQRNKRMSKMRRMRLTVIKNRRKSRYNTSFK